MVSADIAVLTILGVATVRGIFLGLIRELFSIAGLIAASLAVRFGASPAAQALLDATNREWPEWIVRVGCGALIVVLTLFFVALLGRLLQRGAQAVGLGWADRSAGGLLGAAEGLLVAGILLTLTMLVLGKEHRLVKDSQSLATLEQIEKIAKAKPSDTLPSVSLAPAQSN